MTLNRYIAGGRTLAAIAAFLDRRKAHWDGFDKIRAEIGSADARVNDRGTVRMIAIPLDGMPKGYRKASRDGYMRPTGARTEAAHKVREQWAAVPIPDWYRCLKESGVATIFSVELGETDMGVERHGGTTIISLHRLPDGSSFGGYPLDCERIPESRYWLIREAAGGAE